MAAGARRWTPWRDVGEWRAAWADLHAQGDTVRQRRGLARVQIWQARTRTPHAAEATGALVAALLQAREGEPDAARPTLSLALIRCAPPFCPSRCEHVSV
jgi:hypothetical protein